MINNKTVLAIIPARKGSKRLPSKNKLNLNGKPLISWTIESAKKSKFIDCIVISSDDEDILNIAKSYDLEPPFIRPDFLSNDEAKTLDVIIHSIDLYKSHNKNFDIVILLQPTSPLRDSDDIDNSLRLINNKNKSIVSVSESDHSPEWSNVLPPDLSLKSFIKEEIINKRSQDLPTYYKINGAIYVAEIDYLLKNKSFFGDKSKAYIMPKNKSIDIDNKLDFEICKIIMNENN